MEQLIGYFKDEPRYIKPGDQFPYSNSNYILLAAVIKKVTGRKYEHVVREYIFSPLGMTHSGFDFLHLDSVNKAVGHVGGRKAMKAVVDFDSTYAPGCGSMYATARDLYSFYRGLCNGMVISNSMRERAFVPRQADYGYGWFRYELYGTTCVSHGGGVPGFVAEFKFSPKEDLCIVLLNNRDWGKVDADAVAGMVFGKRRERSGW